MQNYHDEEECAKFVAEAKALENKEISEQKKSEGDRVEKLQQLQDKRNKERNDKKGMGSRKPIAEGKASMPKYGTRTTAE